MSSRLRIPLLVLLVLAILIASAVLFAPWKSVVEAKLKAVLEAQGFQHVQLTVSSLGFKSISIKDITLGGQDPLVLRNLTLNYSLAELWSGRFNTLALSGLDIEGRLQGGQWSIQGVDSFTQNTKPEAAASVPMDVDQLIPFQSAKIEDSQLHLNGPWQLSIPLNLVWQKTPQPQVTYQGAGLSFKAQALQAAAATGTAHLALEKEKQQWRGPWELKGVAIKGAATPLPSLDGAGEAIFQANRALVTGRFKSADGDYVMEFKLTNDFKAPEKSRLTIVEAALPWNKGRLSVHNVSLPLSGKSDVSFPIKVEHVSVEELMQSLTGKQATGTGLVSGMLPVTVKADGTVLVHEGGLKAETPGKITLSPDAIPGDNEQVALVREILKDLHYTLLSMTMESGPDGKSSVLMSLEGLNPAVYNGRAVKLNIRLTGDVLNLIHQSIMPLLDPRLLLKQDKHEKN